MNAAAARTGDRWPVERIVDGHCHVASPDYIPPSFIEGTVDNVVAALAGRGATVPRRVISERYGALMDDGDCDELIAQMNEAGIGRAVLLFADFTYALKDSKLEIAAVLKRHLAVLERHPGRFELFAGVDPRWGAAGIEFFDRAVQSGKVTGLKLYPPCGFLASDDSLFPLFEICREHSLPVLVHTGATSPTLAFDTSQPEGVDRPALNFPSVNFILAHGSTAYVDSCVMMCAYRPNVYLDISAYQSMPLDHLLPLFKRGINHKIIFGTDWPVFRAQGRQADFVDQLIGDRGILRDLHPRELENIFHGTMEELLGNEP